MKTKTETKLNHKTVGETKTKLKVETEKKH
jgi:hypothetical protein